MACVVPKSCSFKELDCKPCFSLQLQAKSFKWSLSLLRASGVFYGVCQILRWEADPKISCWLSGAGHKSLIQSLVTDMITHIKYYFML